MSILEHINLLRDAVSIHVVSHHLRWEIDQFSGVQASAVGIEVCEQVVGRDGGVVRPWVAKVAIP